MDTKKPIKKKYIRRTDEELVLEAAKYISRIDFENGSLDAYQSAYRRGMNFLDEICSHMPIITNTSSPEKDLLGEIKKIFPEAKKYRITKLKIKNKPFIHWFELDIFIPEINRGIEFDGSWSHSLRGLKRGRPHWPDSALKKYHQIKDRCFASKGIQILHIKEEDWNKDKKSCVQHCLNFLRGDNVEQVA